MKLKPFGRLASLLIATLLFALPTLTAHAQGNILSICGKALNSTDNCNVLELVDNFSFLISFFFDKFIC